MHTYELHVYLYIRVGIYVCIRQVSACTCILTKTAARLGRVLMISQYNYSMHMYEHINMCIYVWICKH